MRTIATFAVLAITLFCGCDVKTKLQVPVQDEFLKVSDDYYSLYCHAQSREAAISELRDYLAALDAIQKPWATKVRYSEGRSLAEVRLSLIYEQLGDSQEATNYMDQAIRHMQEDPYFDKSQPYDKATAADSLKRMVEKIDSWNSIAWKKTAAHDDSVSH